MPALDNEKLILNELVKKYNTNIVKAKSEVIIDDLKVSVDFIWKEKKLTLLLEVDSYNAAKIIFGEYVLLNQIKSYEANCILVIIHCYKKYNIERTEKYLKFAVDKLKCKLPYVIFSNSEWRDLVKNQSKTELINIIKKRTKPNK
jgi:hypothetical protein